MPEVFSPDDVAALLPRLLDVTDTFVARRAVLAERLQRHRGGEGGVLPEVKALEAQLSELLDELQDAGVQIKGTAPLLLDFPMDHDGRRLLLCWLEGDREVAWYHEADLGFLGRRPLTDIGLDPIRP